MRIKVIPVEKKKKEIDNCGEQKVQQSGTIRGSFVYIRFHIGSIVPASHCL